MKRTAWLVLALALLSAWPAARAEMCESVGEYEYTYGDAESIMQAKQRCENLAIRAAIEQCALFVSSTTAIENYELKNDLVATLAAAVVKQKKVLEHRVEGRTIYYKVSIKLDDEQMSRAIEAEMQRRAAAQPAAPAQAAPTQAAPAQAAPAQPVKAAPAQAAPAQPTQASPAPAVDPYQSAPARAEPKPRPVRSAAPARPGGHVFAVMLGQKTLKKDDWDPLDKQGVFGLGYAMPLGGGGLGLTLDMVVSAKQETVSETIYYDGYYYEAEYDDEGSTLELAASLRYTVPLGARAAAYAGLGVARVAARISEDATLEGDEWYTLEMEGSAIGMLVNAGAQLRLGAFVLGADLRLVPGVKATLKGSYEDDTSEIDLEQEVEAGGTTVALTLGWSW